MLNQEAIDKRRVPLDQAALNTYKPGVWQCNYCQRRFVNEATYMRHSCPQKVRALEIHSPLVQSAFSFYNDWMKKKKFGEKSIEAFMESRMYNQFKRFAQMVKDANIQNPTRYVSVMIEEGLTPDIWCSPGAYAKFLNWADAVEKPLDQVANSVKVLMDIADKENVAYGDIIAKLGHQRILQMIMQRNLSPWFLLNSQTFQNMLLTLEKDELKQFNKLIDFNVWLARFEEHIHLRTEIKEFISGVGL